MKTPRFLAGLTGLIFSASITLVSAAWTPPANASIETIYDELRTDFQEKRYEDALAKHLWFHEKSKDYPALAGVRLSYALGQWLDLGKVHPPALEKMKSLRDQLEIDIAKDSKSDFVKLMDLFAFNRTLGDSKRNVAIFVSLDAQSSPLAKQAFILTFGTLVTHQEFKLAGKYLNSEDYYATALSNYQFHLKFAADKPKANADRLLNYARESFINKTSTAVAVLVKIIAKLKRRRWRTRLLKSSPLPNSKPNWRKPSKANHPSRWGSEWYETAKVVNLSPNADRISRFQVSPALGPQVCPRKTTRSAANLTSDHEKVRVVDAHSHHFSPLAPSSFSSTSSV
jgi:hypothetical protein